MDIVKEFPNQKRWKQAGDLCLTNGRFDDAELCFKNSNDFQSLFLLYTCLGDKEGVQDLAKLTMDCKKYNISFSCFLLLREVDQCLETLIKAERYPEAAFFAKAYCPSHITRVVELWKAS